MAEKDPRVDEYIAAAAPFAQPILKHLRQLVHAGCPDVEETIKWGFPHFEYEGNLGGMAAFKGHCTFGFWKGELIFGPEKSEEGNGMGQFGRLTQLSDVPDDAVFLGYVRQAVELNEEGV